MPKDPFEVVVQGLLKAGQAAGLGSIARYENDNHYKSTIDRTAKIAVETLRIELDEQASSEGAPRFRIHALED